MKPKVAVGISGGVDSALSAALLKNAGYDVVGVYLHCFPASWEKTLDCTDKEDFKMAQEVAKTLGIPFTFFDLEKAYQEKVIDYFFAQYKAGRTPNPDAVCNKEIKFGLFLKRATRELGVDFVATGHYSRITTKFKIQNSKLQITNQKAKIYNLLQGVDKTKDQSYFLYNLSQKQLSRILFPVGEYTKVQVREMARNFGLPNWQRKDSQGICFLGKVSVRKFLEQRIKPQKGEVVDTSGRIIGEHDGVWFYTIGQRHGFRIRAVHLRGVHSATSEVLRSDSSEVLSATDVSAASMFNGPYYVIDKDIENNRLIVGWGKECERKEFLVEKVNWINELIKKKTGCKVRIRHLGELYPCRLKINGQKVKVVLKESAWGVAPGQVAVFYLPRGRALRGDGEEVLGGGVIAD